jgi:hypothetical protein
MNTARASASYRGVEYPQMQDAFRGRKESWTSWRLVFRCKDKPMKRIIGGIVVVAVALLLLSPLVSQAGGARGQSGVHVGSGARHGYQGGYHGGYQGGYHGGYHGGYRGGYYGGYYGHRYPGYWGPWYWGPRLWIGSGLWWGAPYYSYPSPPAAVQQPPIYVEPAPPPEEPQYWYYCQDAQGYYPYVQQCPKGWMKVVPQTQPPGQ